MICSKKFEEVILRELKTSIILTFKYEDIVWHETVNLSDY